MKIFKSFLLIAILMLCITSLAYAGVMENVKGWITENAITYILTGLLAIGVIWKFITVINRATREIGEVFIKFADMTNDPKVTTDEWKEFKKEIRDVVNIFKPTPPEFKVK